jgi:hypothetical protein
VLEAFNVFKEFDFENFNLRHAPMIEGSKKFRPTCKRKR